MSGRRQPARRRPAPGAPSAKQRIAMLKRSLQGHANKLNHVAPPQITKLPFYPLVVNAVIAAAGTEVYYTPASIVERLITQLGLNEQNKATMLIKIQRVDAYCM